MTPMEGTSTNEKFKHVHFTHMRGLKESTNTPYLLECTCWMAPPMAQLIFLTACQNRQRAIAHASTLTLLQNIFSFSFSLSSSVLHPNSVFLSPLWHFLSFFCSLSLSLSLAPSHLFSMTFCLHLFFSHLGFSRGPALGFYKQGRRGPKFQGLKSPFQRKPRHPAR